MSPLPRGRKRPGDRLIHQQLRGTGEQNKDQGRSPETCSFHRELLRGNKAADVRNAPALFARAALCLRQRRHASACRFKSYCCSGLGASLFPLPFRQAWSQPGIKLFKSSSRASQLNSRTERAGGEIPSAPALSSQHPVQHKAHWSILVPLVCSDGDTSSASTAAQRHREALNQRT